MIQHVVVESVFLIYFISVKNNYYLKNSCKLLGDETNIEQPSKYGYYSGVYPFWFKKNL